MRNEFDCTHCGHTQRISSYIQREALVRAMPERCTRCGAVHSVLRDDVSVISPMMMPAYVTIVDGAWTACGQVQPRLSPWMPAWCRPINGGYYDVRFHELEPESIVLWWDNYIQRFCTAYLGQRVDCRTLLAWRGAW